MAASLAMTAPFGLLFALAFPPAVRAIGFQAAPRAVSVAPRLLEPAPASASRARESLPIPKPASSVAAGSALAKEAPQIHSVVTGRPNFIYADELEHLNAAYLDSAHGIFPPYDKRAVVEGEKSLLSVGEGDSDFVTTLLTERRAYLKDESAPIENIHAVDFSYSPEAPAYLRAQLKRNARVIVEHPYNYHGQLFQDLDLVSPLGESLRFDEIISANSFLFVIDNPETSAAASRRMVERLVDHLKPGGVIRMWPLEGSASSGMASKLKPILEALFAEGRIINYSIDGQYLLVQRAQRP